MRTRHRWGRTTPDRGFCGCDAPGVRHRIGGRRSRSDPDGRPARRWGMSVGPVLDGGLILGHDRRQPWWLTTIRLRSGPAGNRTGFAGSDPPVATSHVRHRHHVAVRRFRAHPPGRAPPVPTWPRRSASGSLGRGRRRGERGTDRPGRTAARRSDAVPHRDWLKDDEALGTRQPLDRTCWPRRC